VPSTCISEWLPHITHFNTFVLTHKNANEPARVMLQWQNSDRTSAAVVLSVMADVIPFLQVSAHNVVYSALQPRLYVNFEYGWRFKS
jgi:hypothetical protein